MRRELFFAVSLSLLIANCSGRKPEGGGRDGTTDSARITDSIVAVAAPRARSLSFEERQGAALYDRYCTVCHGQEGKGDGFNAYNLDPRPRDFSDSAYMKALGDEQVVQTIVGGGRSVNKSPLMPAYGWTLKRQQIRYLEEYVRTFANQ